jgi:hypothetical protein
VNLTVASTAFGLCVREVLPSEKPTSRESFLKIDMSLASKEESFR